MIYHVSDGLGERLTGGLGEHIHEFPNRSDGIGTVRNTLLPPTANAQCLAR